MTDRTAPGLPGSSGARRVALIVTEPSGDRLGAALMEALRAVAPDVEIFGMAGPRMRAAGCEPLEMMEDVAVMGIVEVLRRYPALRRLRSRLVRAIAARRPHVVVGIDAPDFNLGALLKLGDSGAARIQFVSPQVWAWRRRRVKTVARAADVLLSIFPFEEALYAGQQIDVRFVGHPVADEIPLTPDRAAARRTLGIQEEGASWLTVMPGSRSQEIRHNADIFFAAAAAATAGHPERRVLCPYVEPAHRALLEEAAARAAPGLPVTWREQAGREALAAADVALVASGTATLEALLSETPLVVGYRMPRLNYWVLSRMVRVPFVAMPNILAGRELVPEFVQDRMTPRALADALDAWFNDPVRREHYRTEARALHRVLRKDASRSAAEAVLTCAAGR